MTSSEFSELKPMLEGVEPITLAEHTSRIEKAQMLMSQHGIDALILESGSGLEYITGVRWGRSERLLAAILPISGEPTYVCPAFEEARLREKLILGDDVRIWQEHESPYDCIAEILTEHGNQGARLGIEESTRFFVLDGIRSALPSVEMVSADPITVSCRGRKSRSEIALIQRAMDITAEAFKACIARLCAGMSQAEFFELSVAAHRAMGVQGHIDVQFGTSTAFPHGSSEMTYLKAGDVVLMDGGCRVEGYCSDISRTIVFGEPTPRQREIWKLEQDAQAAAFEAATNGSPMENVDAAARAILVNAGFGPGYQVPGLPHRTGHGIGLDVHEHYYVVQGNKTPLAPGMCFSNEPMIAIYGEFGVRLEDCVFMTEEGPRYFTEPSPSIDSPFQTV